MATFQGGLLHAAAAASFIRLPRTIQMRLVCTALGVPHPNVEDQLSQSEVKSSSLALDYLFLVHGTLKKVSSATMAHSQSVIRFFHFNFPVPALASRTKAFRTTTGETPPPAIL